MKKPTKRKPSDLVYVLTNESMPDLIKIGITGDLEARLKRLSSKTEVPLPFECYYCCEVESAKEIEKMLHNVLEEHRINPKREFFRYNHEKVKMILEKLSKREVRVDNDKIFTAIDSQSLAKEKSRQSFFTFGMVGIKKGAKLTFIRDKKKIATVTGDREIMFKGKPGSLSGFAQKIMKRTPLRGPDFWIFDNETLTERRIRMENEIGYENEIPAPSAPKKKKNSVKESSKKSLFSLLNIKNGATLTFCKDETKVAKVIDAEKGKIMFDGEPGSLSGTAQNILGKDALQGPKYWKYKGKILNDMREKIENKNN